MTFNLTYSVHQTMSEKAAMDQLLVLQTILEKETEE